MAGKLIVLEGSDRVGKTTIAIALSRRLALEGQSVAQFSFPGKVPGTLGDLVYKIHHDPRSQGITSPSPAALQALHVAAHIDAIERQILPALAEGKTIVLDRFWWSTWAYGTVAGVSSSQLNFLIEAEMQSWEGLLPSAIFLIERDEVQPSTNSPIRDGYRTLAAREKMRYPVFIIQNRHSIDDSVNKIIKALS